MKNSPQSNSPLCQRPAALQKRRIRSFLLPRNHHPWILLSFRPLSLWQRALKLRLPLLHRIRQIPRPSPRDPFFPHLWFVLHRIFFFSSLFTFCECKLVLSLIMQSLSPSCMLEYRQPIFLALREAEVSGFLMVQIFSTHHVNLSRAHSSQEHFSIRSPTLQPISPRHRAILVDWMIEVHQCFKWQQQTLYIVASIVNRLVYSFTSLKLALHYYIIQGHISLLLLY